uniref:Myb/SANT-like domain-containing protein n=1 Tax=Cannabis sativa TaxID=3483 RepID=A0A803NXV4_CANSA
MFIYMNRMDPAEQSIKIGGKKHQWTAFEDSKLVECLLCLINNGNWKSNNGSTFKNGYLQQLEKLLHEKIPRCELKAHPHIDSRIKILKKQCHAISDMLGDSANRFEWNAEEKCIVSDKNVFDEWVKNGATEEGATAKGLPNKVEEIAKDIENDNIEITSNPLDALDGVASASQTSSRSDSSISGKMNRKRFRSEDALVCLLIDAVKQWSKIHAASCESIARLANCFQHHADAADRRMRLFSELKKINGLTNTQRVRVGKLLVQNQAITDYFFSLDDEFKHALLVQLLE